MNKRFLKEITYLHLQQSQKELLDNDYLIYYDESDMNVLHSIIKAPYDSVYRHKFIRLDLKIPDNYPHSPPEVTFINYDGVRIHPNMYENGKCCATILNTWGDSKFEKWTSSMGIETVLLTFHSFLDNNPYTYEPGGGDDTSYTDYVLYQSWTSCLIRYLQNEKVELFNDYIHTYMLTNIDSIFSDLGRLETMYPNGYYFSRCFEIDRYMIDYSRLSYTLQNYYNYINFSENYNMDDIGFDEYISTQDQYECCICYDTETINANVNFELHNCRHIFHKYCLKQHVDSNGNVCAMCRTELSENDIIQLRQEKIEEDVESIEVVVNIEWVVNPITGRRIKVGGKTWIKLRNENVI